VERLRTLIEKALGDRRLHDGARRLAGEMAKDDPDAAVRRLEALAGPARREVGSR
jgi:hypothetical protein